MKRYQDYDRKELSELTELQIADLVSLECLHEGIKIPIKPIEPLRPVLEPRDECFAIPGFNILMRDKVAIEEISSVLQKYQDKYWQADYKWRVSGNHKYLTPKDSVDASVCKQKFYIEDDINAVSALLNQYDKLKKEYDESKKVYDSEMDAYNEVAEKIKSAVNEASRQLYVLSSRASQFRDYLRLSEGDLETAKKFYLQANPNVASDIEEIILSCNEVKE
jgi:hypothetical protein